MIIKKNFERCNCECPICVGASSNDEKLFMIDNEEINSLLKTLDLSFGKIHKIYTFGKISHKVLYIVGKGDKELNCNDVEKLFHKISKITEEKLAIELASFGPVHCVAKKAAYVLNYCNYEFDECKNDKFEDNKLYKFISDKDISEDISDGLNISTAVNNARDLINKPYNYLNAEGLAEYTKEMVETINNKNLSVEILDKKQIEELKMGAFLAVNKGSKDEPRLICIKYNGNNDADYIGLVGKGLMYDTGGYSIKSNMCTMKDDMSGAATVIAVMEALANNNVKANVYAIVCATDNRIDGGALLPDDVVTASNGTTIEIVSTDAEGRLTLADGLLYAQEKGCKEVIDIATLTGACVRALGEYITGLFGNDRDCINNIIKASEEANEMLWELPITEQIRNKVRGSQVADLTNSTGALMGASGAAAFLEAFINKDVKWMHLDIAGTAFHTAPNEYEKYGATGAMVKTLYNYILNK